MALFKILRGNAANLPKEMKDGYAYFCTDTHDFYIDYTNGNGNLTRGQLNAKNADHATTADSATKAGQADKLTTARSIGLKGAVNATPQSFNGTSAIDIPVNSVKEAYLTWGGKNYAADFSPLDASLIEDLGANRFSFAKAAGITIEASKDGGATWTEYPNVSDIQKRALFTGGATENKGFVVGADNSTYTNKNTWRVRFTLHATNSGIYSDLVKFAIYVSTSGSSGCKCNIYGRKKPDTDSNINNWDNLVTGVDINGWSGWNIININKITFGNNNDTHYKELRFEFYVTTHLETSQYSGLSISRIMAFGGMGWSTPSNMAKNNHLYSYDGGQNATFPAKVTATALASTGTLAVTGATTLTGALTANGNVILGNATTDTITINGTPTIAAPLTLNSTLTGKENISLAKDLTVGGNTILGDTSSTDTTTLNSKLTANGTATFNSTVSTKGLTATSVTDTGTLSVTGATTLNSTLTVASTTTLNAALNVNGTSSLYGNLTVTGNTVLGDGTGDTVTTSGAFTAGGATTLNSTLTAKEAATFQKTLTVNGNTVLGDDAANDTTTLNSKLTVNGTTTTKALTATSLTSSGALSVSGNSTLNNNLTVKGNTFLGDADTDNVTIKGSATISKNLTVSDHTSLNTVTATGTLTVGGITTLNSTLSVKDNVTFDKDLITNGNIILGSAVTEDEEPKTVTIYGTTQANGNFSVIGQLTATNVEATSNLIIGADASITGALSVEGSVSLGNASTDTTTINGDLTANNNLFVNGNATLGNATTDTTTIKGKLNVDAATTLNNILTVKNAVTLEKTLAVKENAEFGSGNNHKVIINTAQSNTNTNTVLDVYGTIDTNSLHIYDYGLTVDSDADIGGTLSTNTIEASGVLYALGSYKETIGAWGVENSSIIASNSIVAPGFVTRLDGYIVATGTAGAIGIVNDGGEAVSIMTGDGIIVAQTLVTAPEFKGNLTGLAQKASAIEWTYF